MDLLKLGLPGGEFGAEPARHTETMESVDASVPGRPAEAELTHCPRCEEPFR